MERKEEVSVLKIYSTAFSYMMHHFKLYFSILAIYMVLALIPSWGRIFSKELTQIIKGRLEIVYFIIAIINIKVFMALIISIRETIAEHSIDMKRSFSETKENYWPYFRNYLLVAMIMFIPMLLWAVNSTGQRTFFQTFITGIGVVIAICLHTFYGFAPEIAVVFGEKRNLFHKSHALINGYFDKVLLMNLPSFILLFIALAVDWFIKNPIVSEIFHTINLLTVPFFEISTVIMIIKLYTIKAPKIKAEDTENKLD